ncbi:MAG: hypothetical protein A4E63_02115 [Syntrophorhabdus sp. PtaU1.Bin050]|nr:MAG: hypothetical protein A4E63_02115 [Syntrophorhabdus sp. PtaU1.Bin050]
MFLKTAFPISFCNRAVYINKNRGSRGTQSAKILRPAPRLAALEARASKREEGWDVGMGARKIRSGQRQGGKRNAQEERPGDRAC